MPSRQEGLHFPIVGIGASAGGLEALEQFLRQVPEGCGIAFVIVQHLDPTHIGIMPRTTKMSDEAREVLRPLVFSEKQIAATDGSWFSVRIMPYRTMEDIIGGMVITFSNITAAKKLEAELREEIARLKGS